MIIIPAIDLKSGRCVRLTQGESNKETIYSDNPVVVAKRWVSQGANRLHVIDLDGAFDGEPRNLDWVLRIKKETKAIVQFGGGLRSFETISKVLESGVDYVILGTVVFTDPELTKKIFLRYKNRVMVALDVKNGYVSIRGWTDSSGLSLDQALETVEGYGGEEVIFTDIGRDGMLEGVNLKAVQEAMSKTRLKVYASGGVTTLSDIQRLDEIQSPGCIVGKALYEGKINLNLAFREVQKNVG